LERLSSSDIIDFLRHLKLYEKDGTQVTNSERAVKRKLSSLRSFYGYYNKVGEMSRNPAYQVDMPKLHDKAITRLDADEVAELLDNVESGNNLTDNQLARHQELKVRDLALLTLMLGTGIRVSECVGLDINDVDFDNDRIKVVRKGGSESFVYFGDEVRNALLEYMEERKNLVPAEGHENALFISRNKKRLCVRSVENLVKKYARTVTTVKHITPHKLRSTYGTSLYQESGDIYLVADVLGHKDVNTTRRHYAEIVDNNRRRARNMVKLRED
jgi:integrase/recombinase XerC